MEYISTRDSQNRVSGSYAIQTGIARDGGLFVPESIPELSQVELDALLTQDYKGTAQSILSRFLTDYTEEELAQCVDAAYGERFTVPGVIETVKLGDECYITELFHGPTCAFKDMALQIMPHLMTRALKHTGERRSAVILTATSGDTGKAALEGFADVPGIRILVFYPQKGVSNIQKLQMTTQQGENVGVCAIQGNFDNAQSGVKELFGDKGLREELDRRGYFFSSANSINVGRLLPQIVYYVHTYCTLVQNGELEMGEKLNFTVPTGNFGNILAAYYARRMGLPIGKLVCASNQNDVLTEFLQTGVYDAKRSFYTTMSPSMDILVSSNLERLLFELSGRDDKLVESLMAQLKESERYQVPKGMLEKIQELFAAGCCDDADTAACIKEISGEYGYVPDPHTAVALKVCRQYREGTGDQTKNVVISTASPFKFCESVLRACGLPYGTDSVFQPLDALSQAFGLEIPEGLARLKSAPVRFTQCVPKEQMKEAVISFLK